MNMARRRISTKERVAIFEREGGICHFCNLKVQPGEEWDVSHEIPLEIGGEDGGTNLRVAHRTCHRHQTKSVDIPRIAKTKRQKAKHLGAVKSRNPLPAGRGSKWKKKMDGTVVPR
jgi:5-methylcytosine-specific restriction endonuclease McrA